MKVILGSKNKDEKYLKLVADYLEAQDIEYETVVFNDMYKVSTLVAEYVTKNPSKYRGIIIDDYGTLPFMVTAKYPYIICAQLNDEHSAKMTRDHNNANVISMGTHIIGIDVMLNIVRRFIEHEYAAGRHQIRVDMLNEMRNKQ